MPELSEFHRLLFEAIAEDLRPLARLATITCELNLLRESVLVTVRWTAYVEPVVVGDELVAEPHAARVLAYEMTAGAVHELHDADPGPWAPTVVDLERVIVGQSDLDPTLAEALANARRIAVFRAHPIVQGMVAAFAVALA